MQDCQKIQVKGKKSFRKKNYDWIKDSKNCGGETKQVSKQFKNEEKNCKHSKIITGSSSGRTKNKKCNRIENEKEGGKKKSNR